VSDKKKITMLDLVGSPSFNYTAAADALNTAVENMIIKIRYRVYDTATF